MQATCPFKGKHTKKRRFEDYDFAFLMENTEISSNDLTPVVSSNKRSAC